MNKHIYIHVYRHRTHDAFVETEHPRGQPGNPGEFAKKGSGASSGKSTTSTRKAASQSPKTRTTGTRTGTPSPTRASPPSKSRTSSFSLPGSSATTTAKTTTQTQTIQAKAATPSIQRSATGASSHLPGGTKTKTAMQPVPQNREEWPDHIRKLVVPPAWTNLRYNPDPKGERLLSGYDSKGRLQTLYSAEHWQKAGAKKYAKVKKIIAKMPDYVKKNNKNLNSRDAKTRQHAEALGLIMETGIRPGSERDTKATEQAYGITTIQGQHVVSEGSKTYLRFVGKDRVHQSILIDNRELAASLKERAKQAGPNGKVFPDINDNSLRRYSRDVTNNVANPKDFRTALGTSMATSIVQSIATPADKKGFKKAVKEVCTSVSQKLGNTPDICFKSYISPYVWEHWEVKYAR